MANDRAMESEKKTENIVDEERNLQGIRHEKSEQAVETPSASPAKDISGEKETIVWQAPPAKGHCE